MRNSIFTDIQHTWDIIGFDEGICMPSLSEGRFLYGQDNPFISIMAVEFAFEDCGRHVYYAPFIDKTVITDDRCDYWKSKRLFKSEINLLEYSRTGTYEFCFLYAMVIGTSLVYRKIRIRLYCTKTGENEYRCGIDQMKEECRYVFGPNGLVIEKPDKTYAFSKTINLPKDEPYDSLEGANRATITKLYKAFIRNVDIKHKDGIQKLVRSNFSRLDYNVFILLYGKTESEDTLDEPVPDIIQSDLSSRMQFDNTSIRLNKHLTLVMSCRVEKHCIVESTRIYFDETDVFFFVFNPVTGAWSKRDPFSEVMSDRDIQMEKIDADLLNGTCMEKSAKLVSELRRPNDRWIQLKYLFAVNWFLCAEQALKINGSLFDRVVANIYEGRITDRRRSVSKVLGITGPQIKFLENISIPDELDLFAKCVNSKTFKESFPDIQKRIFAVSLYLNRGSQRASSALSECGICMCAPTINALERTDPKKRDWLIDEYCDYIHMRSRYLSNLEGIDEDAPLYQELTEIGELPLNMKPSRIKDYHDRVLKAVWLIQSADKIVNYTAKIEKRKEKESGKREYTDGVYSIRMPKDAEEIITEGRKLSHCVGTAGYIEAMAAEKCTILFLRDNARPDEPLITVEVRDGAIRQCYGYRDSINSNEEIRDFIKEYAKAQDLQITAKIYSEGR